MRSPQEEEEDNDVTRKHHHANTPPSTLINKNKLEPVTETEQDDPSAASSKNKSFVTAESERKEVQEDDAITAEMKKDANEMFKIVSNELKLANSASEDKSGGYFNELSGYNEVLLNQRNDLVEVRFPFYLTAAEEKNILMLMNVASATDDPVNEIDMRKVAGYHYEQRRRVDERNADKAPRFAVKTDKSVLRVVVRQGLYIAAKEVGALAPGDVVELAQDADSGRCMVKLAREKIVRVFVQAVHRRGKDGNLLRGWVTFDVFSATKDALGRREPYGVTLFNVLFNTIPENHWLVDLCVDAVVHCNTFKGKHPIYRVMSDEPLQELAKSSVIAEHGFSEGVESDARLMELKKNVVNKHHHNVCEQMRAKDMWDDGSESMLTLTPREVEDLKVPEQIVQVVVPSKDAVVVASASKDVPSSRSKDAPSSKQQSKQSKRTASKESERLVKLHEEEIKSLELKKQKVLA